MYCIHCGKELQDGSRFCPQCGQPVSGGQTDPPYGQPVSGGQADPQAGTAELVRKARGGDQSAISALYEQTYHQAYYTVKSMIRDEDTVMDILQDSYIKAFSHLDSFEGGEKFTAWIRRIAANTARDWLKKQRPLLFSELEQGSDTEIPAEERFEDENTEHLPEYVIDRNETSRLIREILEELPEDQRAVIGMYYYEEMSVKEIAASMNATENAVKSRLLYGRRKIEKKVRELEKKGTKLYGLAPVPFLLWLLRGQKTYAAELPDAGVLRHVLQSIPRSPAASAGGFVHAAKSGAAQAAGAAGAAKTAAAAGAGLSAAKIAVAAVAAAAVIGGGIWGVSGLAKSRQEQPLPPPVHSESPAHRESSLKAELSGAPDDTAAAASAVSQETTAETSSEAPEAEPEPVNDPMDKALEQYRTIIANADTYDFGEYAYPNGTYLYALEYMDTADPVPSLLLCQCGDDFVNHIRVFRYDPSAGTVAGPTETIEEGVAQTGGFRGGLGMLEDGSGICVIAAGGMRGDVYAYRISLRGDRLVTEEIWTGQMGQEDPSRPKSREIAWCDISDLSGFESIPGPGAAPDAENEIPS